MFKIGHIGNDKKFYIVDTARLLPPEKPINGQENSIYYNYLNPAYVRSSERKPLNSDVFSPFAAFDDATKEDESNISKLSEKIYSEIIPSLALRIVKHEISNIKNAEDVKKVLHTNFLCMRHLPNLVFQILQNPSSSLSDSQVKLLIVEMFARLFKRKWYKSMHSLVNNETQKGKSAISQTLEFIRTNFDSSKNGETLNAAVKDTVQLLRQGNEMLEFFKPEKINSLFDSNSKQVNN